MIPRNVCLHLQHCMRHEGNGHMSVELPDEIQAYLAKLRRNIPGIKEIWLFGSRANDAAREDSDWDFWVFGDARTLNTFRGRVDYDRADIDLLIVYDGDRFEGPWERPLKRGSLTKWKWNRKSDDLAEYEETKWIPDSHQFDSGMELASSPCKIRSALRVWPTTD